MRPRTGFLKTYLYIAIFFGIIGLTDTILSVLLSFTSPIYAYIIGAAAFLFFFFNLAAIAAFKYSRAERIAYILPVYHLVSYLAFFMVGLVLIAVGQTPEWLQLILTIWGIIASVFEIGFSFYLLKKLDFYEFPLQ
ncbi:MAG: hypothetical protein AABW53_00040 [Nanoarchaeota archaeon]